MSAIIKIMRKILAVFFLAMFLISIPSFVFGVCQYGNPLKTCENCPEPGGLVPCGRNCDDPETIGACECDPCTLCHFFVMIDRVLDFLLFKIVPVLAALMIAIGGFMYIFAFGKPEMISQAKRLFAAIAIGLLIIYGAWVIINTFFAMIGLSDFGLRLTGPDKWFIINCQ